MSIDNPQAIKWSNEKCRVIANSVIKLQDDLQLVHDEWNNQNITQYFPVGGGEILILFASSEFLILPSSCRILSIFLSIESKFILLL